MKYKPRGDRGYAWRWGEFKKFQSLLASLEDRTPALDLPPALIKKDVTALKAGALKEYEDLLDSVICAYIAYYYWVWGEERCAVLGNLREGYIVTPVFDHIRRELSQKQTQLGF